jgi:hypothetical protein
MEEQPTTSEEQKQSETPVKEIHHHHHHYHHKGGFDIGRIFWALIIILIGFVLLGNNFGWFSYNLKTYGNSGQ